MRPARLSGSTQVPTRPTTSATSERGSRADRWTRRRFLQTTAGAAAIGAAASAGLVRPGKAFAGPGIGLVDPIPTTFEFFPGVQSHVQAPPFLFGPDSDPATVYNFQGVSALAYISGTCTQRNRLTGETTPRWFKSNDMRLMKGVFRGHDGHVRNASFGFV
jgi:hypothetical protein